MAGLFPPGCPFSPDSCRWPSLGQKNPRIKDVMKQLNFLLVWFCPLSNKGTGWVHFEMTSVVGLWGLGGHHKDLFLGRSSLPWCPLSNQYFDVSCPELAWEGSVPCDVLWAHWVVPLGGNRVRGGHKCNLAWEASPSRPNPTYSANCANVVQTHPTKGMERRVHQITFWNSWHCSKWLMIEMAYPEEVFWEITWFPWPFPSCTGVPPFSRHKTISGFLFLKPVCPQRCTSEARLYLLSLCKKKLQKNLAHLSHTVNTSQSFFVPSFLTALSSDQAEHLLGSTIQSKWRRQCNKV